MVTSSSAATTFAYGFGDRRSSLGQSQRDRLANAARAAGDQSHTVFQVGQSYAPGAPYPEFTVRSFTRVVNYEQEKLEMLQCEDREGGWVHRNYLIKQPAQAKPPEMNQINAPAVQQQPSPQR